VAKATETTYRGLTSAASEVQTDVLFILVWGEPDALADLPWLNDATGGEIARARASGEFNTKLYDVFVTPVSGKGCRAKRIALVGAGAPGEANAERVRRLGATCGLAARSYRSASYAVVIRGEIDGAFAAQHLADGCMSAEFDGG
jgi:hypothetical protein